MSLYNRIVSPCPVCIVDRKILSYTDKNNILAGVINLKFRTYSLFGALGFLLPGVARFFIQGIVFDIVYAISALLVAIFFFGYFSHCTGKGVKFISLFGGIVYTLVFALSIALIMNYYGVSFAYLFLISLKPYQPIAVAITVGLFCIAAMLRAKRDLLCVVLCTLSIVACIMPFYPGVDMGANLVFALTLLYFFFKKLKF